MFMNEWKQNLTFKLRNCYRPVLAFAKLRRNFGLVGMDIQFAEFVAVANC